MQAPLKQPDEIPKEYTKPFKDIQAALSFLESKGLQKDKMQIRRRDTLPGANTIEPDSWSSIFFEGETQPLTYTIQINGQTQTHLSRDLIDLLIEQDIL